MVEKTDLAQGDSAHSALSLLLLHGHPLSLLHMDAILPQLMPRRLPRGCSSPSTTPAWSPPSPAATAQQFPLSSVCSPERSQHFSPPSSGSSGSLLELLSPDTGQCSAYRGQPCLQPPHTKTTVCTREMCCNVLQIIPNEIGSTKLPLRTVSPG